MSTEAVCPCDAFPYPLVITNPPGLTAFAYRVAAYPDFRHAMLLSRPGETALTGWQPGAYGDLAVQMIEWWAYLADILTFYNERIANELYLQTALLPESVQGLIRILGYRPRPGIGAQGTVAALLTTGTQAITLPVGFQIQSKPAPGQQPQTFEVSAQTTITAPATVSSDPPPNTTLFVNGGVLLKGVITSVKTGDSLLLVQAGWDGSTITNNQWITVTQVNPEVSPRGHTNTRITFSPPPHFSGDMATNYRLLRNLQTTQLFLLPTDQLVISSQQINLILPDETTFFSEEALLFQDNSTLQTALQLANPSFGAAGILPFPDFYSTLHLASLVRGIHAGDMVMLTSPSLSDPALAQVSATTEVVWTVTPSGATTPILAPHTQLTLSPALNADWDNSLVSTTTIRYDWRDVGAIISTPANSLSSTDTSLYAALGATYPPLSAQPILLEAADGSGIAISATANAGDSAATLSQPTPATFDLLAPLNALLGLVPVTRGKTVANEVLGSGDASVGGQSFKVQNSPLTYLLNPDSSAGGSYKSTLQVWVNNIQWKEVPNFYGQPATAQVFVMQEDSQNSTWVTGGDGVNGARFPTGTNNIMATYRYGSGAIAPAAGALTVVSRPYPGLKSLHNPVAVGGGADPDSPAQIRNYAPQSILALGRAVSGDDYEAIAAQAPGVTRAKAYWSWDNTEQRAIVTIYVGDDSHGQISAQTALNGAADPNRPMAVKLATPVPIAFEINVTQDPNYQWTDIVTGIQTALADPAVGLFGKARLKIGQVIYKSQISQAIMNVPGVIETDFQQATPSGALRYRIPFFSVIGAIEADILRFHLPGNLPTSANTFNYDPGEGGFFTLDVDDIHLNPEGTNG